jgi:nitroreductase
MEYWCAEDTMNIQEAIIRRRSIRSFKPIPIPKMILEEILDSSRWAPSSSNTQPCEIAVLGGNVMEELSTQLYEKVKTEWDSVRLAFRTFRPDIPFPELPEPYRKRAIDARNRIDSHQFPPGTPRIDEKRAAYLLYGAQFYGAPNAIIIYTERVICPKAILDVGLMAQTIALAALAHGLGTCLMTTPVAWPEILRELLGIPKSKLIALAIAIGYPEGEAKVNNFERTRVPLESMTHWHGF